MSDFKPGMKVRHKSGGPVMIVERVGVDTWTGQARVWCEWFDSTNLRNNQSFVPEVLEGVQDSSPAHAPPPRPAIAEQGSGFFERQ